MLNTPICPIPRDAPDPPRYHPLLGTPTDVWDYRDKNNALLGHVCRFETPDGKEIRPLTLWPDKNGKCWHWKSWPAPKPLYGLDSLSLHPNKPVLVVEGEKCADAATTMLKAFVVVTSPGGSNGANKVDWSNLAKRQVIIWPDLDDAGIHYGNQVAKRCLAAGVKSVAVVEINHAEKSGWDIADAINEGWTEAQMTDHIRRSVPFIWSAEDTPSLPAPRKHDDKRKRSETSGRSLPVHLLEDYDFWRDTNGKPFVSLQLKQRQEHLQVSDKRFSAHLMATYHGQTGGALSVSAENELLRVAEARAISDGATHKTLHRVAAHDGCIFIDLADEKGQCLKITKDQWSIQGSAPVKFLRQHGMLALPTPKNPGPNAIEALNTFCNVRAPEEHMLMVGWLLGALMPSGPYPILVLNGEMGSGKSFFCDLLAGLVDPHKASRLSAPRDERDLVILANHRHILTFDNISSISRNFSDSLCRISTGGAFVSRKLHSDDNLVTLEASNPIILNRIPFFSSHEDLADRSIFLNLQSIPNDERLTESDLKTQLSEINSSILGTLLDAVVVGLANNRNPSPNPAPRMADFIQWVEGCAPALGWENGRFTPAYIHNKSMAFASSLDVDPVAQSIVQLMQSCENKIWKGTPTDLLKRLSTIHNREGGKDPSWPRGASALSSTLRRLAPLLRNAGYQVSSGKSGQRFISIAQIAA